MKKKHTVEIGPKTTLVIEVEEKATTEEILDDNHDVIDELVTEMVNGYEISVAVGEGTDDVLDDATRERMRERANAWMDENSDGAMDHVVDIVEETCREAVEAKVRTWADGGSKARESGRLARCGELAGEAEKVLEEMRAQLDSERTKGSTQADPRAEQTDRARAHAPRAHPVHARGGASGSEIGEHRRREPGKHETMPGTTPTGAARRLRSTHQGGCSDDGARWATMDPCGRGRDDAGDGRGHDDRGGGVLQPRTPRADVAGRLPRRRDQAGGQVRARSLGEEQVRRAGVHGGEVECQQRTRPYVALERQHPENEEGVEEEQGARAVLL